MIALKNSALMLSAEPDNEKTLKKAFQMTDNEDLLCIAGSLYLAGAMRSMLKQKMKKAH